MSRRSLAEWVEFCREAGVDEEIVGTAWVADGITPPPVPDPPLTRYPLERAAELAAQAEAAADEATRRELRLRARAWLDHPHPRTSPRLLDEMERLRRRLR